MTQKAVLNLNNNKLSQMKSCHQVKTELEKLWQEPEAKLSLLRTPIKCCKSKTKNLKDNYLMPIPIQKY